MAPDAQRVIKATDEFRDVIARLGESEEDAGGRLNLGPVAPPDSSRTLKSSEAAPTWQLLHELEIAAHGDVVRRRESLPSMRGHLLSPTVASGDSPSPPAKPRIASVNVNPWLQLHTSTQSGQKNEILVSKDSAGADRLKKQVKKRLKRGLRRIRKLGTMPSLRSRWMMCWSYLASRVLEMQSQAPKEPICKA
ncbi:hypothetical protein JB92DRAFT_2826401 [Gautieria morchelliformis]|nr:hypothetical protein JB92DRAFT_2826401 [Gautieria morchelliformis]